jgi:hypothetical protein
MKRSGAAAAAVENVGELDMRPGGDCSNSCQRWVAWRGRRSGGVDGIHWIWQFELRSLLLQFE